MTIHDDDVMASGARRCRVTVLSVRALNRATLARQLLLERADMQVRDAVAHLCGLQAQEPQEPFTGLWSRLRAFGPAMLSDLLVRRRVVRTHLMRRTVHLLAAEDVLAWRARHDAMLRQRVLGTYRRELDGVDLEELAAAGRAVMADGESRSMAELVRAVAGDRRRRSGGRWASCWSPRWSRWRRRRRAGCGGSGRVCATCCCPRGWAARPTRRPGRLPAGER
ncbi:DNA glycosylase AlkZ-like family protein [Actinomadura madurae]|uniref:DNA glycosylase AlkZ-like family protein n=1 Tax=Actinomadura madurae TaxID=1993 RepID=UPI0020D207FF|nr:crosslink repair DNA glycosylase YcaQ family protein [Actinomadura madurae]